MKRTAPLEVLEPQGARQQKGLDLTSGSFGAIFPVATRGWRGVCRCALCLAELVVQSLGLASWGSLPLEGLVAQLMKLCVHLLGEVPAVKGDWVFFSGSSTMLWALALAMGP